MAYIVHWINKNKEWIFSGIGVSAITLILAGIRALCCKKKEKRKATIKQINSGEKATQIGVQNNYYMKEENDG